jgi:hypothetical protein
LYYLFCIPFRRSLRLPRAFLQMFQALPAARCVPMYEAAVAVVPWDALRRRMVELAPGPELFLTFRNEFAR